MGEGRKVEKDDQRGEQGEIRGGGAQICLLKD